MSSSPVKRKFEAGRYEGSGTWGKRQCIAKLSHAG